MALPHLVWKYVFFLSFVAFLFLGALTIPAAAATQLSFNSTDLRFGEVVVGRSESLPVTVTNVGASGVTISTTTVTTSFGVSHPPLPLTLAPKKSLSLNITFHPATLGTKSGNLAINGINVALDLHGTGVSAKSLLPNPPSPAFGRVQVGTTAKLFVTLTNGKNVTTTVSRVVAYGTGFGVQGLPLPLALTPGQSFTFTATFSPRSSGLFSGTLQVMNPMNSRSAWVPLSGAGTATGQLSISPASVSFGNVSVGTTASRTGQLSAGGASVTVTAANSNSSEFSLRGISLPVTLAAGQSIPYSVAFTPQSSGTASATLSFASNASTVSESLTGSGVSVVQHSVNLSWNPSPSQVTGYNVYRGSAAGGPYAKVNSTLDAATAYTDSTVASAHTYYYVTTAVNSSGQESTYSNQVRVAIP